MKARFLEVLKYRVIDEASVRLAEFRRKLLALRTVYTARSIVSVK